MRAMMNRGMMLLAVLGLAGAGCSEARSAGGTTRNCTDADQDGFGVTGHTDCDGTGGAVDCNDNLPAIHPGATEIQGNGLDENCNGMADDAKQYDCTDVDGDGYGRTGDSTCPKSNLVDCNDADKSINPGAREIAGNGKDDDCKGGDQAPADCIDHDTDGYGSTGHTNCTGHAGKIDCDDNNVEVNPGKAEVPGNDIDENCDNYKAPATTNCEDNDHDGYGKAGKVNCGEGGAATAVDCDDNDPQRFPDNPEKCNAKDDDCDTTVDECPANKACDSERLVCLGELRASCEDHLDCNEGLRCEATSHKCLGWTDTQCGSDADCYSGHCDVASRLCVGTGCESLHCADQGKLCSEELGCYDCDDSAIGHGCDAGLCAGHVCYTDDTVYYYDVYDYGVDPAAALVAFALVDCKQRSEGQARPFLCGGFSTVDFYEDEETGEVQMEPSLESNVTESDLNDWVCNVATEFDFAGGAEDLAVAVDIAGCGLFNLDDLRFSAPLRAGEYYNDCAWIDGDMIVGPCESFPAPRQ